MPRHVPGPMGGSPLATTPLPLLVQVAPSLQSPWKVSSKICKTQTLRKWSPLHLAGVSGLSLLTQMSHNHRQINFRSVMSPKLKLPLLHGRLPGNRPRRRSKSPRKTLPRPLRSRRARLKEPLLKVSRVLLPHAQRARGVRQSPANLNTSLSLLGLALLQAPTNGLPTAGPLRVVRPTVLVLQPQVN